MIFGEVGIVDFLEAGGVVDDLAAIESAMDQFWLKIATHRDICRDMAEVNPPIIS